MILLKYVILITVTKNSAIIITNYTWYHRYKETIQITGGSPLWLHRMPDSKAGRRKVKCSDIIYPEIHWYKEFAQTPVNVPSSPWAFFDDFCFFPNNRNCHLVMVLLAQTDMAECQSWCKFSEINMFCSVIILG